VHDKCGFFSAAGTSLLFVACEDKSVGNHYVPREYLRGFTEQGTEMIWVYDKRASKQFRQNILHVCQQTGYYSDETEKYLAQEIEATGHPVLRNIRTGKGITSTEKQALSIYIATLLKRGRWSEDRFRQKSPKFLNNIIKELRDYYANDEEFLSEIDRVEKAYQPPPREIWEKSFDPRLTPILIDVLSSMRWLFLVNEESAFLTSDNPLFIPNVGLRKKNSEFSLPISSRVLLWASSNENLEEGYLEVSQNVVKELNRRTCAMFFDQLFSSSKEEWIPPFAKKTHQLSFLDISKLKIKRLKKTFSDMRP
jgi:hypothetical protein